MRVRLFHWKAEEAQPLLALLKAAGHSVDYSEPVASYKEVHTSPPNAIVIDLSRLPSHGKEVAVFLRGSKATRHIPIIFVGGEPEKIEGVRKILPDAVFTPMSRLRSALRSAIANPPTDPLKPAQMMDRYGSRTTAQKLGIVENSRVFVVDPPSGYARAIGDLPSGACYEEESVQRLRTHAVVRPRPRRISRRASAHARSRVSWAPVDSLAQIEQGRPEWKRHSRRRH